MNYRNSKCERGISDQYSDFRLLKGNRPIIQSRVEKIKESFVKIGTDTVEITVNAEMEIIDGQHRFKALQDLDWPVPYIIEPKWGLKEAVILNNTQDSWSTKNYLGSFCDLGVPDYVELERLMCIYGFNLQTMIQILGGTFANGGNEVTAAFKTGDFTIHDLTHSQNLLRRLKRFQETTNYRFVGARACATALCAKIYPHHEVTDKRLARKFNASYKGLGSLNYHQYVLLFSDLWNSGLKPENQVEFLSPEEYPLYVRKAGMFRVLTG